ncbi:MAG: carbohydrate ABC transporter permease, partial [Pseudomonadota bacterium]
MIVESRARRRTRAIAAWAVVAVFVFPLYYWVTTAFKNANEIFNKPPNVWSFEPTFRNFEEVFGISLGFFRQQEVLPGGGNFYMAPRLWDSIVVAVGSTALAV